MRTHRNARTISAAFLLLAAASPLLADYDRGGMGPLNIVLQVTLERTDREGRKSTRSWELLTPGSGKTARLTSGSQIPIPTQIRRTDNGPVETVYGYRNTGLAIEARTQFVNDRSLRLDLTFEDTSAGLEPLAPKISGATRQAENLLLIVGKPVVVSASAEADGSRSILKVEARIAE